MMAPYKRIWVDPPDVLVIEIGRATAYVPPGQERDMASVLSEPNPKFSTECIGGEILTIETVQEGLKVGIYTSESDS